MILQSYLHNNHNYIITGNLYDMYFMCSTFSQKYFLNKI